MEDLIGNFLISTPQMSDPRFQEQVIFLCAHNEEGAMGLVINNPNHNISLREVFEGTNLPIPEGVLPPVYMGGPVEQDAGFILYSSDYLKTNSLDVTSEISLSRDSRLLMDIAHERGPAHYLFMLGYAGWGPGQLETELVDNGWLTVPGDYNILFNTPDELKWKLAAHNFGVDISVFGDVIGNA
ncbi:MAG: YqgE/AlgH family protein [Candidatus Marinimicrobia bacterium]|nr:YqgE/AlgH family protein [Candidatus Neomarinimicrobiota bacterium]